MQNIAYILIHPFSARRFKTKESVLGWTALIVMILAGSTFTSFGKELSTAFSPMSMLFVSDALLLAFAVISFGLFPLIKKITSLDKRILIPILAFSAINGVSAPFLWYAGLVKTTAVNAEIFIKSEILFLIILSCIFFRSEFRRHHALGALIIISGLAVVSLKGFSNGLAIRSGDSIIIMSGMLYATGGILIRKKIHKTEPEVIMTLRALTTISFFFLLSPFVDHTLIEELIIFPPRLIFPLIGFGLISRFLSMFAFYEAIERIPIPTFSIFATLTTAGSALFAFTYLGEPLHWYQMAGIAIIISGAAYVHLSGLYNKEEQIEHHIRTHHRHHL